MSIKQEIWWISNNVKSPKETLAISYTLPDLCTMHMFVSDFYAFEVQIVHSFENEWLKHNVTV